MNMRIGAVLMTALALAACEPASEQEAGAAEATSEPASAEAPELSMQEFMTHVVQYSAENVWKWQGWVSEEGSERSLFPKNDEEWQEAENAALTLAEVTKTLLEPGRRVEDEIWLKTSADTLRAARDLASIAETQRNEDAFFEAGARLYEACAACHVRHAPGAVSQSSF